MPVEHLSVWVTQLLDAELAELLGAPMAVICACVVRNFSVEGEPSSLEGPDHSVNEKATVQLLVHNEP